MNKIFQLHFNAITELFVVVVITVAVNIEFTAAMFANPDPSLKAHNFIYFEHKPGLELFTGYTSRKNFLKKSGKEKKCS
ncbi:MAG: hypothetical protein N2489_07945 [Clostridia bacterium]|nr:hypothetical protein [Clostridia bacterium]